MFASALALSLLPLLLASPIAPVKRQQHTYSLIQAARDGTCLKVVADQPNVSESYIDGLPVISAPCDEATVWDIHPGSGSVYVVGTEKVLDAGENPGNNGHLKIWQTYPGLFQQTWYLTDDKRIAITGGNQCLDQGDDGIQIYQCTTGNTNQIFNILEAPNHGVPPPATTTITGGGSGPTELPSVTFTIATIATANPVDVTTSAAEVTTLADASPA